MQAVAIETRMHAAEFGVQEHDNRLKKQVVYSTSPRPTDPVCLAPSPEVDPASRAGAAWAGHDRECDRCVTITVYPGLLLTLRVSIFTP